MAVPEEAVVAQVERILHSGAFRNAEALRKLLRFLADKSLSGEADQLKEYTVGIDALGKPPTYDPRQDSVVRIQVGRLRQKLADYYREEGKDDAVLLDLPKGRFKLSWLPREEAAKTNGDPAHRTTGAARRWLLVLGTALAFVTLALSLVSVQLWRERRASAPFRAAWTPDLQLLWKPFLASGRPVLVSASAPLFVGLPGSGFYREPTLNNWEGVERSERVAAVRRALKSPSIFPHYGYASSGVVNSIFYLGKLIAVSEMNVSLARSSQLSWQQMSDNNVILVGATRVFSEQLHGLPVDLPLVLEDGGVRNLRPQPGQPVLLADKYPSVVNQTAGGGPDDGEVFAVVTHAPGPLGSGHVRSFGSNYNPGTLGAVQAFTDPSSARALVSRLRMPSGEVPQYYQMVLKVIFKDRVPTEISYVLHHEIQPNRAPAPPRQ